MRKLTLTRKWSIIECASKIYFSYECEKEKANTEVDGKPYFCGLIKNGKSIEVEISDEANKIYLTSSTMEAEFVVPAGTTDVKLLAVPHYNVAQGNPFTISEIK